MSKCPLCNSSDVSIHLPARDFSILKCNACTNAWTDPPPGRINYEERDFHRLEIADGRTPIQTFSDLPKPWQKSMRQQLRLVQRHVKPGSSILEIGCGHGIFLEELKKLGYATFGIEPSATAAQEASQKGLDVVRDYFPSVHVKGKKFDLIVLSHVFEHIEHPSDILRSISEHLGENGKILFVQTYYKGMVPRLLGRRWYAWLPEQHFWHFTPNGITKLAAPYGLKELDTEFSTLVYLNSASTFLKNCVMFLLEESFRFFPARQKDQFHLMMTRTS